MCSPGRYFYIKRKTTNTIEPWNIENVILTHSSERSPRCPRRRLVDPMFVFQITTDRWSTVLFNHHGNISQSGIERGMVPWALAYIVNDLILIWFQGLASAAGLWSPCPPHACYLVCCSHRSHDDPQIYIYIYTDIQIYRYTDIQIYRYIDIQIYRSTDIQI